MTYVCGEDTYRMLKAVFLEDRYGMHFAIITPVSIHSYEIQNFHFYDFL